MSMKMVQKAIQKNNSFVISTHVNPDPDALCSELAMMMYLKSLGKKVRIINEEIVPDRYLFLPGANQIKSLSQVKSIKCDAVVVVDCGELNRIGKVKEGLPLNAEVINIDHHITNDRFGHVNLVEPKASSTAELLFEYFESVKAKLTKNMAIHLYTGIMTDTGCFRYENTTAKTHLITAKLRKFPFSAYQLYRQLYESIPLSDIEKFTKVTSRFESASQGKVVYVKLTQVLLNKFSDQFDIKDAVFKFIRAIQGVEVVVIFTELNRHETRINFRSSGKVNVAKVAKMFGGGGHHNASGGYVAASYSEVKNKVLKQLQKELKV